MQSVIDRLCEQVRELEAELAEARALAKHNGEQYLEQQKVIDGLRARLAEQQGEG